MQKQKISRLEANIASEEQTRNSLERSFNGTRSFDILKEQESHLIQLNEEDQVIINDDDDDDDDVANSDRGKRSCHASPRKDKRDLQKIWRDLDGCRVSCGRHDWGGRRLDYQRFESDRQSDGRWSQRPRGEAGLSAARPDLPGRALPFQHRRQSRRLPRRTHLAPHFGGRRVCG